MSLRAVDATDELLLRSEQSYYAPERLRDADSPHSRFAGSEITEPQSRLEGFTKER